MEQQLQVCDEQVLWLVETKTLPVWEHVSPTCSFIITARPNATNHRKEPERKETQQLHPNRIWMIELDHGKDPESEGALDRLHAVGFVEFGPRPSSLLFRVRITGTKLVE